MTNIELEKLIVSDLKIEEKLDKIKYASGIDMITRMNSEKRVFKFEFKGKSYIELLRIDKELLLKKQKNHDDEIMLLALEELLHEKVAEMIDNRDNKGLDEISKYFNSEKEKINNFVKETRESLLTEKDIKKMSKNVTEENLNYKRLVVAIIEGNITEEQRLLMVNEYKKNQLTYAKIYTSKLSEYETDLLKYYSLKKKKF